MKQKTNSEKVLEGLEDTIKRYRRRKKALLLIQDKLDQLPFEVDVGFCGDYLNLNYLKHEQTIEVIKLFPGKWSKEYSDKFIHYIYEGEEFLGHKLRIFCGDPPPNCKLVEDGEEFVPGYTRKKFKLQCTGVESPAEAGKQSEEPAPNLMNPQFPGDKGFEQATQKCDCSRWVLDSNNRCVNCGQQH